MRVISRKRIQEARILFPSAASSLDGWYRVISKNTFANFSELKEVFGSVDKVGSLYVFNIGGNKVRSTANIH